MKVHSEIEWNFLQEVYCFSCSDCVYQVKILLYTFAFGQMDGFVVVNHSSKHQKTFFSAFLAGMHHTQQVSHGQVALFSSKSVQVWSLKNHRYSI